MDALVRDIETRSKVDLTEVGTHIYAAHPSTVIMCVAYAVNNEPVKIWHPGEPVPKAFVRAANGAKWDVVAHNAAFEIEIERVILGPRHGFPLAPIEQQVCTMALAHAMALPGRLERIAKACNLEHQKDMVGARLMKQISKPRKALKHEDPNETYYYDDPERLERNDKYCMEDVEVAREIYQCLPALPPDERATWLLDHRVNNRGFFLDRELAEAARQIAADMNPEINAELTKITNGVVTAFTQVARITKWIGQHADVKSIGKGVIEDLLKQDLPNHVHRVLELRLLGAQAAVAKVDALLQRRCADGRVRGSFIYHAAGPGRWSSRGAQVHNLKRPLTKDLQRAIEIIGTGDLKLAQREYKNPLSVIGDCIRAMICAKLGYILMGGDFSGIEARVTAWLAREEGKLDVFRVYDAGEGPDPYIIFAAEVFNLDPEQIETGYKAEDPIAREQRQVGKAGELGFGFQGGVKAYRKFAPDTEFSDEEIDDIKNKWRRKHPRIVNLWHQLNSAMYRAVRRPGEVQTVLGRIEIVCDDQPVLWMTLPSGRRLSYPHARIARTYQPHPGVIVESTTGWGQEGVVFMDNTSGKWQLTRMYGGLATENAVQAIARDLLRDAMLRVDAAGYEIVTHVHDECVIEVPIKQAEKIKPKFTKLMMQSADWADGLPVVVNAWINPRYLK
jgi:DNA polymerase bacteriophage-type